MSAEIIINEYEENLKEAIRALNTELTKIRTGRANLSILDRVTIDYYGTPTPINQVAALSIPEPRMILIKPWDKAMFSTIEKAVIKADLGLSPANDGEVIRLPIPQLTEERRKELVKQIKKRGEEFRVRVRNERRDFNEKIKGLEKKKEISEDLMHTHMTTIQEFLDDFIKQIDQILEKKEQEVMKI